MRRSGFFRAWNYRFPATAYLPAPADDPLFTSDC